MLYGRRQGARGDGGGGLGHKFARYKVDGGRAALSIWSYDVLVLESIELAQ